VLDRYPGSEEEAIQPRAALRGPRTGAEPVGKGKYSPMGVG